MRRLVLREGAGMAQQKCVVGWQIEVAAHPLDELTKSLVMPRAGLPGRRSQSDGETSVHQLSLFRTTIRNELL